MSWQSGMILRPGSPVSTGRLSAASSSPHAVRDLAAAGFRKRRVLQGTFLCTLAGVVLYVMLLGIRYEANTHILVKHRRADEVISTDSSSRDQSSSTDVPTERELNTEISLLKGGDLVTQVVKDLGLTSARSIFGMGCFRGGTRRGGWRKRRGS